jgi:hypothetical protein
MPKRNHNWVEDAIIPRKKSTVLLNPTMRKRQRNSDDELAELFDKKTKFEPLLSNNSDDDDDDDSTSDNNTDDEFEETQRLVEECASFFKRRAPIAAKHMYNRQGIVTAPLVKVFLNTAIRMLDIRDARGQRREAGNDIVANCQNLRSLYRESPLYFRSIK